MRLRKNMFNDKMDRVQYELGDVLLEKHRV